MVDHEHPQPTRTHQYRYLFTHKHHCGHGDAQWLRTLTEDEEFAVFDGADEGEFSDARGNLYGALRDRMGSLRFLGTYDEQIAKFWRQPANTPWHGHPIWAINHDGPANRRKHCEPPRRVFDRMVERGLITAAMRARLIKGKHV